MAEYSTRELMIVAAAREIRDHEVVFVGMRLPIAAFGVARQTHAPNAVGLFECGLVRNEPAQAMLYTMGDPPNQLGAVYAAGTVQVMGMLQAGRVDAGFIGGAEIDRFGNINTSYIGGFENAQVKLPGSGGAADIAGMSRRLLAIMGHEKRRLVPRVGYITSPGGIDGGETRRRTGLPWGGPSAVITDRCILRPHGPEGELHVASLHPGNSFDEVAANTGWPLRPTPDMGETPAPSKEEMAALRRVDPDGFWR